MSGQQARNGDWIAVDWGTTNMRAALVADDGTVRARSPNGPGMAAIAAGGAGNAAYEAALAEAVAPWLGEAPVDVLVCGMAGARQGWLEAPYADVPARLDGLLAAAVAPVHPDRRLRVRIVPGLCVRGKRPDVMRGEETQLLGLTVLQPDVSRVCLPGTHAKWVEMDSGRVETFRTHMTGEINALLSAHSVLRSDLVSTRDAPDGGAFDKTAFDDAVRAALDAGGAVLDRLFAIRARGLLSGTDPGRARATLSGLLIGAEIALEAERGQGPVHVVGGRNLGEIYVRAMALAGIGAHALDGDALAVAGLAAMRQGASQRDA